MLRFGVIATTSSKLGHWSTFIVNVVGSFLLGWLMAAELKLSPSLRLGLSFGLLGALTTFSTFSLENAKLLQEGKVSSALTYVLATNVLCILVCYLGYMSRKFL